MTAPTVHQLNALTLPLQGRQLIEASAGTGKTWTLAALYLRLVLGHAAPEPGQGGLLPPQILVMTFTEAATAELRQRIRDRLAQASAFFRQDPQVQAQADPYLHALRASFDVAQWPACAYRLELAAQWMDDAAIFTIHGWSHRMLREHAFESRSLFEQTAVEDGDTLKQQVAQDYWRRWYTAAQGGSLLAVATVAQHPQDLLGKVQALWANAERSPLPQDDEPPRPDDILAQSSHWFARLDDLQTAARAAWTPAWVDTIAQAAASKQLKGHPANHLPGRLEKMAVWQAGGKTDLSVLQRFTVAELTPKWAQAPDLTPLQALDDLAQHLSAQPDVHTPLLAHAAWALRHAYQHSKAQLAQFDFQDLLQRLYHALQGADGRMAHAIRQQFPVALVDEFQDTDPWQYGALDTIYPSPPAPSDSPHALILIGDPKQAIYSFRGADLATYLRARATVHSVHTLNGNRRSSPALVDALNHIFEQAHQPFGDIPYQRVTAERHNLPPLQSADGSPWPAFTVWHPPTSEALNAATYQHTLTQGMASQMVNLLHQGVAPPRDMAVLVRSGKEADLIRTALAQRGVKSVYLSERNSVLHTPEAVDLWRLLCAVLEPRRGDLLRAALSSPMWCWPLEAPAQWTRDETQWEAWLDRLQDWHQLWRTQGVLPMLHRCLHDTQLPGRLFAQDPGHAERRLTNLLQLGEWLQTAATGLHSQSALLRHLENHLRHPHLANDQATLRLESDDDLVKVVTMHKSKGLQYPLVFVPFAAGFHAKDGAIEADADDSDEEPPVAENLRLLYVALTRAERGLWLGVAPLAREFGPQSPQGKSALSYLLGRRSADDLAECLAKWAQHPHILVAPLPPATADSYQPPASGTQPVPARTPQRRLLSHWWTASFSALVRPSPHGAEASSHWADQRWQDAQCDQSPLRPADTELPGTEDEHLRYNGFPAGSQYGTLLHDLLEWQAQRGWPLAHSVQAPDWQAWVHTRCTAAGVSAEPQTLLHQWLPRLLQQPLPLHGGATASLSQLRQPWPEMAFTLPAHGTASERIDHLVQQHLWPSQDRPALPPRTLQGMLTGFMDLVFEHAGRYYVLDHKSNKLPQYGQASLESAMLEHRYDVQLALYLLALHRLLSVRLPGYDYDRHVGGAVYLFLRGIDAPGAGTLLARPPKTLIQALDAALRGHALEPLATQVSA